MDLEPKIGLGLSANIRMQLNMRLINNRKLSQFRELPSELEEIIVPLVWFENSIEEPPGEEEENM